jgi:hypothetical protein
MRTSILFFLSLFFTAGFAQKPPTAFNTVIKVHTGISNEQIEHVRLRNAINDTGSVKMDFVSWSPTISYTQEFALGRVLYLSGNIGFQYMNLYYGPDHYGAPFFWFSVNPMVMVYSRKKFEYYVKLRAGCSIFIHEPEIIPEPTGRLVPRNINLFTGVTLGGFNYFINDKIGLNLELSIWSPELATFGISYRWFRGELPEVQNNKNKDL